MSSKLKLRSTAGGSVSIVVNDAITSDIEHEIDANYGIESDVRYTKFPDGTLMQYGRAQTIGSASLDVIMDEDFIDTNYSVNLTVKSPSSTDTGISHNTRGINSFTINSQRADALVDYIAIGRWK